MVRWHSAGQGKSGTTTQEAPYNWSDSTIANILEYKEYLGHTVNFKTYCQVL